ncbi:MAG: DUF1552 domain-containing protein [Deltaproteobacteria bacterium]|nr:DUF1552 domain-containing protein [Deltaproteobacteria bacterium]
MSSSSSYRVARRSFLRGIGAGAVGLKVILRNLEAMAAGVPPPPRFLMTHWPVGTVKDLFLPSGTGSNLSNLTLSNILKPFQPLTSDMILLYGLNTIPYHGYGGGHEAGTPQSTTGALTPGTRSNGGETDDAVAGGPSWDQIFLKTVPGLNTSGAAYANAICDARVDSFETSTQCLSYGYSTRSVAAAVGGTGGQVLENTPLLPVLSPLKLFQNLFSGVMPGGGGTVSEMARMLKARKSVLDYATTELARMKTLAPRAEAAAKIDVHAAAIRKIEMQLTEQINMGTITPNTCTPPAMPDPSLIGKVGSKKEYTNTPTPLAVDDSPAHRQIGKTHLGILKAAFVCDLIRVGTFQWSPGTNHVSFKGLFPNDPNAIYMHHPTSHIVTDVNETMGTLPAAGLHQDVVHFLANVQTWYNQNLADVLMEWKATTDVYGGNLLANTIIPYITEVADTTHKWNPLPGYIFGGSALGMKGGQFLNGAWPMNSYWATIAQAYFKSATPFTNIPAMNSDGTKNTFLRTGAGPIPGLWALPPPAI